MIQRKKEKKMKDVILYRPFSGVILLDSTVQNYISRVREVNQVR
jgi:hypothetical protein